MILDKELVFSAAQDETSSRPYIGQHSRSYRGGETPLTPSGSR